MSYVYRVAIKAINFADGTEVFINFSQPGLSDFVVGLVSYL